MTDNVDWARPLERFPSGIRGLDIILHGGFLQGGLYLVNGPPGAGKTILGNQIAFNHVASGGRAVYLTLLGEEHSRMLAHLQSLAFFNPASVGDTISYFSGYGVLRQEGPSGLLELTRRVVRDQAATLLILDGLTTVAAASSSVLDMKDFIHELQVYLNMMSCTGFLLGNSGPQQNQTFGTVVDGLVSLSRWSVGWRALRQIEVEKFRGSDILMGKHAFEITSAGIIVYPRLEALYENSRPEVSSTRPARASLDIPGLDEMLRGGVPSGSTTMVYGPTGSGKTLLGLHFLAAGARRGEHGLHFGFHETPEQLVAMGAALGLDLDQQRRDGRIEMIWQSPVEPLLDSMAERLLDATARHQAVRVFIDGFDAFQQAAIERDRAQRFFTALTNELRARTATILFTVEAKDLTGAIIDLPIEVPSAVADNIIFLRYAYLDSRLCRLISVIKVRTGDHDTAIWELSITQQGMKLAEPAEGTKAMLAGLAHPSSDLERPPQTRRRSGGSSKQKS